MFHSKQISTHTHTFEILREGENARERWNGRENKEESRERELKRKHGS